MSSVLCGMFPLRTNSCHQRKHNVWQWMFSLYDSLIWNHYQRSSVLICLGSGGVGVCGAVRAVASDHLKKKAALQPGGKGSPPHSCHPPLFCSWLSGLIGVADALHPDPWEKEVQYKVNLSYSNGKINRWMTPSAISGQQMFKKKNRTKRPAECKSDSAVQ